jgi:hypothetical protein
MELAKQILHAWKNVHHLTSSLCEKLNLKENWILFEVEEKPSLKLLRLPYWYSIPNKI